jgi:hypothetical protein
VISSRKTIPLPLKRFGEELIKQAEAMGLFPQSGRMGPEKKDPLVRETIVAERRQVLAAIRGAAIHRKPRKRNMRTTQMLCVT